MQEKFYFSGPKTPFLKTAFCTWHYLASLKVVPGTKCSLKIFENMFKPKNKIFGPG
jgi:hypothetical protein